MKAVSRGDNPTPRGATVHQIYCANVVACLVITVPYSTLISLSPAAKALHEKNAVQINELGLPELAVPEPVDAMDLATKFDGQPESALLVSGERALHFLQHILTSRSYVAKARR